MPRSSSESAFTVYAAIAANFVIAIAKFVAASVTGSAAMFSEGIHSVIDTGNEGLLLLGLRRSRMPADAIHPFGYGKEIYFWSLIVAILLFGIGGGLSVYEGVLHIRSPEQLRSPVWNYVVLAVAFVAEGASWWIALRKLLNDRTSKVGVLRAFRRSKDPAVFVVVAEDTAALLGVLVAAGGVYLAHRFEAPWIDGAASVVIGLILAGVAVVLVFESRALIVGETANPLLVRDIHAIAESDPAVLRAGLPLTMQMSPDEVLVNMDIEFHRHLSASELIAAIERIELAIRNRHPSVGRVFLEFHAVRATARADQEEAATSR